MFERRKEATGIYTFQFTWSTLSLRFLHNALHNTPNWECSRGWNCKFTSVDLCPVFFRWRQSFLLPAPQSVSLMLVSSFPIVVVPWLLNLCHFGDALIRVFDDSSPNETSKYCYSGPFILGPGCVPHLLFFYHFCFNYLQTQV